MVNHRRNVSICMEPCRRDTFPAIALVTAYLHDMKYIGTDEAVVVCPVDPYVDESYFETVKELGQVAQEWNGGVFAYRLSYVLDRAEELLGYRDYDGLFSHYEDLKKISFDYAVVEQKSNIPILAVGLHDVIVAASADGILIADKKRVLGSSR